MADATRTLALVAEFEDRASDPLKSLRADITDVKAEFERVSTSADKFSGTQGATAEQTRRNSQAITSATLAIKEYRSRYDAAKVVTDETRNAIKAMARELDLTERETQEFSDAIAESVNRGEDFQASIRKASGQLDKYRDGAGKADVANKKLSSGFSGLLSTVGKAAIAYVAAQVSIRAFQTLVAGSIRSALDYDLTLRRVTFALGRVDGGHAESADTIERWARELERASGVSKTFSIDAVSLAVTMGATIPVAKEMAEAAINFAAATGKDANQALNQLVKTLGGYAGELSQVLPGVKALTAEQLKAGEAARVMQTQVGNAASNLANTASGQVQRLTTDIQDLREAFGSVFTAGGSVSSVSGGASLVVRELADDIREVSDGITALSRLGVPPVLSIIAGLTPGFTFGVQRVGRAEQERSETERNRQLAAGRSILSGIDPIIAEQLAAERRAIEDLNKRREEIASALQAVRDQDTGAAGIFQELARAFPPERAAELAESTKSLTDAQNLVADALKERDKAERRAAVLAGVGEDLRNLLRDPDRIPERRENPHDEERLAAIEAHYAFIIKAENTRLDVAIAGEQERIAKIQQSRLEVAAFSSAITETFLRGVIEARNFGDILRDVFNSVLDSLVNKASSSIGDFIGDAIYKAANVASGGGTGAAGVGDPGAGSSPTRQGARVPIVPGDRSPGPAPQPDISPRQALRALVRGPILGELRRADARGL